jgi:PPOX class probable F420-dependent enzyme
VEFAIDTSTAFGARVERRLREELVGWLTTVAAGGMPVPVPVWFLWDGRSLLVYGQADGPKLRNIERSPRASFHLDSDGRGGDIVVLSCRARRSDDPPADQVADYIEKYRARIERNRWTPASFAADYSVPLRLEPERLRGH